MVPDKIFIAETPNKLIEIWSDEPVEPKPYIKEHCYIRKEALLEWLNQMLKFSAQSLEFQRNCAYGKVIDKLNEM